jgi:hypothetical protein
MAYPWKEKEERAGFDGDISAGLGPETSFSAGDVDDLMLCENAAGLCVERIAIGVFARGVSRQSDRGGADYRPCHS